MPTLHPLAISMPIQSFNYIHIFQNLEPKAAHNQREFSSRVSEDAVKAPVG